MLRETIIKPDRLWYSQADADKACKELQSGDEDWTYEVKYLAGGGVYKIAVYDENGEFVRNF